MKKTVLLTLALIIVSTTMLGAASSAATSVNWLQFRRDNQRSGYNQFETTLTLASVGTANTNFNFGLQRIAYLPFAEPSAPVIYKNVLYTVGKSFDDGLYDTHLVWALYAMDAVTGALKWTMPFPCLPLSGVPAIDAGANVILLPVGGRCNSESTGGRTIAVDLTTRAIRWQSGGAGTPAVVGGNAYFRGWVDGGGDELISVKTATGQTNWSIDSPSGDPSVGSGALYLGGIPTVGPTLIYAQGSLSALNASNGAVKWTKTCAVGVCAFNTSGTLKWSFPTGYGVVSLAGNVVYMGCDAVWLCAVNATTGALIWKNGSCEFCVDYPPGVIDSLTVAGGLIYVRAHGGFGVVNAATGVKLNGDEDWRAPGTQAPVVNNGLVYVVTENRINIYGLCGNPLPC